MSYAIETVNLSKEFTQNKGGINLGFLPFAKKKTILAVNDINLQIKKGETFGLLGPNGSGKTTLIKLLCSLILPTKGTAYVNGYNVMEDGRKVNASIGLVITEERSFYWRLTGRQNLNFFAALYGLSSWHARKRIDELGVLLEIEKYMDNIFYEYSTGIRQRFSIARSLLNDPRVLFLDEPTKNLDTNATNNLRRFIKEKFVGEQGKTVLFTTLDYNEAAVFSDRLAIIERGEIKARVTPNKLGEIKESYETKA